LKCYFPTYKRRRWTSLTSNSSDEFIDFKECPIMSSDPEKNKQSLMLSSAVCDVVPPTAGMQLVTFGAGPSHCSWCCPLQLGSPRGHWSGGTTESLWPRELWLGSQDSDAEAEVPGRPAGDPAGEPPCQWQRHRQDWQQWRVQRKHRWQRPTPHTGLGRRSMARKALRFCDSFCAEERL